MKTAWGSLLTCLAFLFGAAPLVRADDPTLIERQGLASLWTTSPMAKGQLAIALTDVISLRIVVQGEVGLEVEPPERWTLGPWLVRADGAHTLRTMENGRREWSQSLLVEPMAPGEQTLTLSPLRMRSAEGPWDTIRWQPLVGRVTSRVAQPDLKSLRDITAIEELPTPAPGDSSWSVTSAAVLAAVTLLALALFVLWRRQVTSTHKTPEAWAAYELTRLQSLRLPERGKSERFGTLLAGLLRRYLEKRHHLPARRQTTGEFLSAVRAQSELAEHRGFLEAFLPRCDIVKFAPMSTSVDECAQLADQLREFLVAQTQAKVPSGV